MRAFEHLQLPSSFLPDIEMALVLGVVALSLERNFLPYTLNHSPNIQPLEQRLM
jgi:hypothetical protein